MHDQPRAATLHGLGMGEGRGVSPSAVAMSGLRHWLYWCRVQISIHILVLVEGERPDHEARGPMRPSALLAGKVVGSCYWCGVDSILFNREKTHDETCQP
jgi:hypothetical protein